MATIKLGVANFFYQRGKSTQQVADILEARYHIMQKFMEIREKKIAYLLEQSVAGVIQNMDNVTAAKLYFSSDEEVNEVLYGPARDYIEEDFKRFIRSREAENVGITGTPTRASRTGEGRKYNKHTPSFIDSGLYVASVRAWIV